MSEIAVPTTVPSLPDTAPAGPRARLRSILRSPRMSGSLIAGLLIIGAVIVLSAIGSWFVDPKDAIVGAVSPSQPPSATRLLGSDSQGRDILTVIVLGTPQTLRIGLIAGLVGTTIGIIMGLISGYFGGPTDATIRVLSDSLMTVPGLAILLIIATNVGHMTVEMMGLTVAALSWMYPTRTIRSQVLSIRERPYIAVARANGESELEVVFREVMPNLLPFIAASFVAAVGFAMLASIGLEALGLGANDVHTLGTTIYWAQKYSAVLRGQWWWFGPPIAMIATIFVGLFFLSAGMDKFANPRLRQQT
jgi:peptide/nickel transport system permease protein